MFGAEYPGAGGHHRRHLVHSADDVAELAAPDGHVVARPQRRFVLDTEDPLLGGVQLEPRGHRGDRIRTGPGIACQHVVGQQRIDVIAAQFALEQRNKPS